MSEITPPPPAAPYAAPQPLSPSDERLWATLIHVGGILFGFLPALIGYLVLKDRGAFIREHTATALNFQLTALIASTVAAFLIFILIGLILLPVIGIAVVVLSIVAAVAANNGQPYKYPLAITFVR